jgi:nucleoside-diphosphate-sugar epimerase
MHKVLITGGAGYIGSELIQHFISDYDITVMDNMMYDTTSLLRYSQRPNFRFVKGDVRDVKALEPLMKSADIVIPLAALVGFPLCDQHPREAKETNFESNLWIANHKSTDQRVIYPCTNSGYGISEDGGVCTEESPLNPVSLYGETKVDAETVYRNVNNCATFRLATVFGPSTRMRSDLLVNNFVLKALKERILVLYECEFMRNYIHITDVCRAFRFVVDNWDTCGNETFNVGNDDVNMNKLQLAQKIKKYMPLEIIKAEFTSDPDKRDYIVSSEKFYSRGFECKYDLDDGIKQLIKVYSMIDEPWYGNY